MKTGVKKIKPKKGFLDGYKTYDTSEGFGFPSQWQESFNKRMSMEDAKLIMNEDDPYVILGVQRGDVIDVVKKAFRKMAMKFHPDKNPGLEKEMNEKMQKIIAAYTIIIDSLK